MFKTQAESAEFLSGFLPHLEETPSEREVVLCPPFTDLSLLSKSLHGSRVNLGAQNVHWEEHGAYTGEIAAPMLTEIGVRFVIVGHSERRQFFGETDVTVNLRLKAAQKHGLTPILCVGETKQQRDAGETESIISNQLKKDLVDIDQTHLIIAYEPIWAIGTGRTATPEDAEEVCAAIREEIESIGSAEIASNMRILYGGSVKSSNIVEIMKKENVDGALIGGASLDPEELAKIVKFHAAS